MSIDFRSLQDRLRRRLLAEIGTGTLTGMKLAEETGFQQAHISNFLNRKRGLSLEAMDAILRARQIPLMELMREPAKASRRIRTLRASSSELSTIPIVDGENCLATEVPYTPRRCALTIMAAGLAKRRAQTQTPRSHWQRFVATRVSSEDAKAMGPRLRRGSLVVVDRHANAVGGTASMYLVRVQKKIVLRYAEFIGDGTLVLRPHNPEYPLTVLEDSGKHNAATAIVGRVCLLIEEA